MNTETPAQSLVFPEAKAATNMPFFDGTTLVFGQSDSILKKTIPNTGTIWKTIRQNKTLAARFKDVARFSEVSYRAWKLSYCRWKDKVVRPISTGLPADVAERNPCFYRDGDRIHLSFVAGVPTPYGPNYRLYTCSGPDLDHLDQPQILPQHPAYFGFVSPHHIGWGIRNVLRLSEKATGRTFRLEVDSLRISSANFLAEDPAKLLLTILDRDRQPHTVLYDLSTKSAFDITVDGPVYKSTLYRDQLVFAVLRHDVFESRELHHGACSLSPSRFNISFGE